MSDEYLKKMAERTPEEQIEFWQKLRANIEKWDERPFILKSATLKGDWLKKIQNKIEKLEAKKNVGRKTTA